MVEPIRGHVSPNWNDAWESYWKDAAVTGLDGIPVNTDNLSAKAPMKQQATVLPNSYDTIEQHPASRPDKVDTDLGTSLPPPKLKEPLRNSVSSEKIAKELEKMMRDVKDIDMDPVILRLLYKFLELQRAMKEESSALTQMQLLKDQDTQKTLHKDQMEAHEKMHAAAKKVAYARWIEKAISVFMALAAFVTAALSAGAGAGILTAIGAGAQGALGSAARIGMIAQLSNMVCKRYFEKKQSEYDSELFDKREQSQELKRKIENKVRSFKKTVDEIMTSYKIQASLERGCRQVSSSMWQ